MINIRERIKNEINKRVENISNVSPNEGQTLLKELTNKDTFKQLEHILERIINEEVFHSISGAIDFAIDVVLVYKENASVFSLEVSSAIEKFKENYDGDVSVLYEFLEYTKGLKHGKIDEVYKYMKGNT